GSARLDGGEAKLGAPHDPSGASASERGAGALGFAGTVGGADRQAAGIAVLTGDGLDTEPRVPMLPGGWDETRS
ncbi:PPW family C-terminal domain-containing PPE protein, partial [[Mycobacterium] crassicus]|nr:hypothetical protein [Mycolicibacter sp. MYC098]